MTEMTADLCDQDQEVEGDARPMPEAAECPHVVNENALLLILATVQFANVLDFVLLMPLAPKLQKALELSTMQFGFVVSSYTFSACLAGLLAALGIDRLDRRTALLGLLGGFAMGTLACGLSNSYASLLVARVVTGAFGGVLGALVFSIIGDVFPAQRRGAATGKVVSAFSVASILGVPFGLFLGNKYGWQAPFFLLAGLALIVIGIAVLTMPSLRGHLDRGVARNPFPALWELIVDPNHLRAFALMTSIMVGTFAVIPFLASAIVFNGGISESRLPWLYVVGGVCSFVSSPLIGKLSDRIGKLRVYRIMAVLVLVPFVALTNLPKVPLAVAIAVVAAMMVCNSGRMVPAVAMITASVEPRRRGGFMSVNSAVQHLAMSVGAFVAGLIVGQEEGTTGPLRNFWVVGLIAVAATLISLPLAGRLRAVRSGLAAVDETAGAELI